YLSHYLPPLPRDPPAPPLPYTTLFRSYPITFTLAGFSTVKRDGIELTGTFVATVNADMKVGALAETITVTGETPVVDVQTAKRRSEEHTSELQSRVDLVCRLVLAKKTI